MNRSTGRRGSRPGAVPRDLLPASLRWPAVALLAACLAVAALLAVRFTGREGPGWIDAAADPQITAAMRSWPALLTRLPDLGTPGPVELVTAALILACLATRRWAGAVLTAVTEPAAIGLTEYVLKPLVGRGAAESMPSGHAASMFALAAVCAVLLVNPPGRLVPATVRTLLVLAALVLAAAVSAAMVAIGAHYFTDVIAGAAVGTGLVLAGALILDLATGRVRRTRVPRPLPDGRPQPAQAPNRLPRPGR